ncbi:MAG: transposase, partial [Dissulfuribacterales bacterium]
MKSRISSINLRFFTEEVVRYIGRYTHRVAISNHRIISISG